MHKSSNLQVLFIKIITTQKKWRLNSFPKWGYRASNVKALEANPFQDYYLIGADNRTRTSFPQHLTPLKAQQRFYLLRWQHMDLPPCSWAHKPFKWAGWSICGNQYYWGLYMERKRAQGKRREHAWANNASDEYYFPIPQFSYTDCFGWFWKTYARLENPCWGWGHRPIILFILALEAKPYLQ